MQIRPRSNCECILFEIDGNQASFSSNGRYIVASLAGRLHMYDASTGSPLGNWIEVGDITSDVAVSDDGIVAVGVADAVSLFDGITGMLVRKLLTDSYRCVAFSPGSSYIVTSGSWTVQVWDAATGNPIATEDFPVHSFNFSPDGNQIVGLGYTEDFWVWDVLTGATSKPHCVYSDGTTGSALIMDRGWLTCEADGKPVCWIPLERRGNWESREGKVTMRSLLCSGLETIIEIQAFADKSK
jgi:WD40 repeat protein